MRVNRRIFSAGAMIFVLLLSTSLPVAAKSNSLQGNSAAAFTGIEFVSNIETIGVAVSGKSLPSTSELSYRQSGESLWHSGHPLMRIDDGRLIGSLFNLLPATSYEVRVFDGASEINGSVSTQPNQLSFTPSLILHVDDSALPGGNGSSTAPFQTIQEAVNQAAPGTQVLVADGIYREAITFPTSGTAGNWIQVKAAGNAAILDSADRLSGAIWTAYSTSHVWFIKINGPVAYLARDGKRFYQYDDRTGLMQAAGHGGVTIQEGWFYEPSTLRLYVRSLDDPANHTWQVPRLNHAFDLAARNWIWIEGFEMQFYGTTTNGCGVCALNTSHIVIRRNKIHNMQLGIFINWTGTGDQGNDTHIEQNEVYDPLVNEWPWTAVKGSFMEGTGIIIRGHVGAIVRDNHVHNFFNGIYTGSSGALENPELAFDLDIYGNYIHDISDDGLEPEGACINQRFRNNTIDRSYVGISLAPITQGPTWVLRSTYTNFTGRGIKLANNSDGIVLIYQNTGWTNASNINGMDLITAVHNVIMRNNTFQSTGYSFAEARTGSTANDWNHNNWYTTRGATGPHFKWENVNYNTISALCTASGLECDGYENPPGFTNPTGGDFTLLSSSPNIDHGVVLPGINDDFVGNAPDVGAYELGFDPAPTVSSSVRANSSPTYAASIGFTVTFSEFVTGVDISDFALTIDSITGASITGISGSGDTYTVTVNTGSGNGTLGLNIIDDDSIRDRANQPLGSVGAGNGNYTNGEVYTIVKTVSISGNVGVASVTLSYTGGSTTADANGNYSFTVPASWSGTVTPSRTGFTFVPTSKTYSDLIANQSGQNYLASWVGGVKVEADQNVAAVGRPHIGEEVASYSGFSSGGLTAYVPMLFKSAFGSYESALYVQNAHETNTANITIKYYDSAGMLNCTKTDTLAPLSSKGYWMPSATCDTGSLPAGWVGGVVVTSDQPIVAAGRPHVGSEVMTYDGFSAGSLTTYLPMLFKDAFGSYDSAFYLQNTHESNMANITLKYYDGGGTLNCTKTDTIAPLASKGYWVPSATCDTGSLPAGWIGGVVVTSDQPIVAVGRPHIGSQVTTYSGFSAGDLSASMPMLFKGAFGGSYDSAFYLQNTHASNTASIVIQYYDSAGTLNCTKTDTIAPLASKGYWVPTATCDTGSLPFGWVGGVVVTSDQPIVAVGRPHIGPQVTTYNGFSTGRPNAYLPMLFRDGFGGSYDSATYLQNLETDNTATLTIKLYDASGNLACTLTDTLSALASKGYWLPALTCAP